MRKNYNVIWLILIITLCFSAVQAASNLNKTDGQIKSQNDVIDFIDGFTGDATFSMNAEIITVDTLVVDSVFSFSGAISVGATTITGNATVSGTVQGEQLTSTDDLTVADDILLNDGSVVGITGNEVLTFSAAGSADFSGCTVDVDGAFTADTITSDAEITGTLITNTAIQTTTLGVGATTFAITTNNITLTGDGGANVLATITAAEIGIYIIEFVDANITVTDTDAGTADTIDLAGTATELTSADDTILMLYLNILIFATNKFI
jgi:hypothetical protein